MKFPVLLVVAANCLWKALGLWAWFWESYWKTKVEAWISRHVELYYITTCLKRKGFPRWIIDFIQSFLTARKTRIKFTGYKSNWIQTETGIPQGSPLLLILFLFFILELLEKF